MVASSETEVRRRVLAVSSSLIMSQTFWSSSLLTHIVGSTDVQTVELLKLSESLPFQEFTAQFTKTKEDYKLQLQARSQKPNEDLDGFAHRLVELVENAYLEAGYTLKVGLTRDQFIRGVAISDDIHKKVFISQPGTLVEAVFVVRQLQSACKACCTMP